MAKGVLIKSFFFFSGDGRNTTALIIGITVGAAVLLLGLIAYVIWKRKAVERRGKIEKKGYLSLDEQVNVVIPAFFLFSF